MNYFITDTHFNHKNILEFDHRAQDWQEKLIKQIQKLTSEDTLHILGDFIFSLGDGSDYYTIAKHLIDEMCQGGLKDIHLVLGNHDFQRKPCPSYWMENFPQITYCSYFELLDGGNIVLSHYPMMVPEGRTNICGHLHPVNLIRAYGYQDKGLILGNTFILPAAKLYRGDVLQNILSQPLDTIPMADKGQSRWIGESQYTPSQMIYLWRMLKCFYWPDYLVKGNWKGGNERVDILMGPICSGKSTLAEKLMGQDLHNRVLISSDMIRLQMMEQTGKKYEELDNKEVWGKVYEKIEEALYENFDIVLDFTNLKLVDRIKLYQTLDFAEDSLDVHIHVMNTDKITCMERLKNRNISDYKIKIAPVILSDQFKHIENLTEWEKDLFTVEETITRDPNNKHNIIESIDDWTGTLVDFVNRNMEGNKWYDILTKLGIRIKQEGQLFNFKYDDLSVIWNNITLQCRGALLEIVDEKAIYVARPFDKFFNYDEPSNINILDKFDTTSMWANEKIDGCLAIVYYYKGEWYMKTGGTIRGNGPLFGDLEGSKRTYESEFWDAFKTQGLEKDMLDSNYTYMFELCTPYENHPIQYADHAVIYLTGIRNIETGKYKEVIDQNDISGFNLPKTFDFKGKTLEEINAFVKGFTGDHEGVVVHDKDWNLMKIKGEEYLDMHWQKGNKSRWDDQEIYAMIIDGSIDDFIGRHKLYEDKVKELKEELEQYKYNLAEFMTQTYDIRFQDQDAMNKELAAKGASKEVFNILNIDWRMRHGNPKGETLIPDKLSVLRKFENAIK